ncbi:MAG: 16S rRNA (cytosine(1402)-N(4))-methyltransferase RsmH [Deltaproteobacteria bacterium]|nr:16S rRNA (cytosine(1402)-N(4))-methyltransferase RsmH [Deltaproteobacteria bacterium]
MIERERDECVNGSGATDVHVSVLADEIIAGLAPRSGGRYIDATLGLGGHTARMLEASSPDGRVLGIDRDPEAIARARARLLPFAGRVTIVEGHFSEIEMHAARHGFLPVHGVIADLGISSLQLDTGGRGFSFLHDGPLDMRMGPVVGETAQAMLERLDVDALAEILRSYGEQDRPRAVARAILRARDEGALSSTKDLARVVERAVGRRPGTAIHPATRVFQAIRIAVNRELVELERFLAGLARLVVPGGRVAVISFHSLEDRLVKRAFEGPKAEPSPHKLPVAPDVEPSSWLRVSRRPITPSAAEVERNPRARSAKLRVAERV